MERIDEYLALRTCLMEPLAEHHVAADLLSKAVDAIMFGDIDVARDFVRRADMSVLFDHASLVTSGADFRIQRRRRVDVTVEKLANAASRLPLASKTMSLFARDGWRCRFCHCDVVTTEVRTAMRALLPGSIPWSVTEGFHGAFLSMSASIDHIVPHSAGGTNDDDNLVTACWSCQFGRGAWSLEEIGLIDPRLRQPRIDEWDGLTRLLRPKEWFSVLEGALLPAATSAIWYGGNMPPPSRPCYA